MQYKAILIQSIQVFNAATQSLELKDIYVENGHIQSLDQRKVLDDCLVISGESRIAMPRLVDYSAKIESFDQLKPLNKTLQSAGVGTTYVNFSVQAYLQHQHLLSSWSNNQSSDCCILPVLPLAESGQMSSILSLQLAGARAFSNAGACGLTLSAMINIFRYISDTKLLVIIDVSHHAEHKGALHAGNTAYWMGVKRSPTIEESMWVSYYIELALLTQVPIHFRSISAARSVKLIEQAKACGMKVSCDTSILHLLFTDQQTQGFGDYFRIQPPLRSSADQLALIEGLQTGVIDSISSMHGAASYNVLCAQKHWQVLGDFWPLVYHLVSANQLSLVQAINCVTRRPVTLVTVVDAPTVEVGQPASFCIFSPTGSHLITSLVPEVIEKIGHETLAGGLVEYVIAGGCVFSHA